MPTPKELKGELEGKFIDVLTNSFAVWHNKRYKVLGYDSDTDLYTCAPTKVEGPLEHIKLKAENITVYVDVIPVEESSEEEDDDDDEEEEEEEESTPYTAEAIRKMKRAELRKLCGPRQYDLFTKDWNRDTAKVPEMKEALMEKFGLEGCTLSDKQQKIEETSKALDAFFLLPIVVAITSTISNFNPKNKAHANSFMEQYREQQGKGPTRSQNST